MKAIKGILLAAAFAVSLGSAARAQSTAQPVLPGVLTTSGCPTGLTACWVPYSNTNPIPVGPVAASSTDASGTVAAGGTYQQIIAASTTRKGCLVQNPPTATEALNVRVGSTTVFVIQPSGTFSCSAGSGVVVSDAIFVTAATIGHAFSANFQ